MSGLQGGRVFEKLIVASYGWIDYEFAGKGCMVAEVLADGREVMGKRDLK